MLKYPRMLDMWRSDLGEFDRPWNDFHDTANWFFDVMSMHSIRELFYISEILLSIMPERIVEYGTASGGLTRLLGSWAAIYGAKVLSIDSVKFGYVVDPKELPGHFKLLEDLPVELINDNEYSQEVYEKVQNFASGHKTFFYCDGGNKSAEFKWCAKILKSGDLLATHDYNMSEEELKGIIFTGPQKEAGHVTKKQAQWIIDKYGLETVFDEELRGGDYESKILAVRLREDNENGNSDSDESVASEKQLSQE